MAQFTIKPESAKFAADEEIKWIFELHAVERDIRSVKNQLGFSVAAKADIRNRLNHIADRVSDHEYGMNNMQSALNNIINDYIQSENKILNNLNGDDKRPGIDFANALWKVVGKAGPVGSGIVAVKNFVTSSEIPAAKWANAVKDTWGTGWKIGDVVKKCKKDPDVKWWKAAIGFAPDSFLKSISKSNLGWQEKALHGWNKGIKGTLREFKTLSGAAKQVGGIALSGVTNGFSNYEEFKDSGGLKNGRLWAETVTETAVDWGKDLLIGAGVTAAFAAAGVAAPVVAVGAATVAVSVAADWVCKAVTGKDLTEAVSDGIIDLVGNGVKKAKEGATALWRNATNVWNKWTGGKAGLKFA